VPWPSVRFAVVGGAARQPRRPRQQRWPTATVAAVVAVAVTCVWARTCRATAVAVAVAEATTDGGAGEGPCACRPSWMRRKSRPTTATAVVATRSTDGRRTIRWKA